MINDSGLDPVYHITYNESETNGNHHLALPNSTVFDTAYPYGKPTWEDDTVNGESVKVMNFSGGNQWMLVDNNGDRLSMPGTYDGWTASMWLWWDGSRWDTPFTLRHPTKDPETNHKIIFQDYGGNKTFYGGYTANDEWKSFSKIPNNSQTIKGSGSILYLLSMVRLV